MLSSLFRNGLSYRVMSASYQGMGGMLVPSSSAAGGAAGSAAGSGRQGPGRDYLTMPTGEDDGGLASFLSGGATSDEVLVA